MPLSPPSPFTTMATSDYYPYPMHTAQDSAPLRRRHQNVSAPSTSTAGYNRPTTSKRARAANYSSDEVTSQPKSVQRVDSGLDAASETSSITFTEEVERVAGAKLYLRQYYDFECESVDEDEEVKEDEEGNMGRKARDSICLIAERASTWESKKVRARRNNRKSKFKMVKKWLKRLIVPGSDGRSWYLTASI